MAFQGVCRCEVGLVGWVRWRCQWPELAVWFAGCMLSMIRRAEKGVGRVGEKQTRGVEDIMRFGAGRTNLVEGHTRVKSRSPQECRCVW